MKKYLILFFLSLILFSGLFAQIFDNALSFDGTDDIATVPHSSLFNVSTLTLEMWVYWESPVSDDVEFLIGKDVEELEIHTGGGAGVNALRFIPTDNVYLDTETGVLTQNEWHHIAFIYDPSSSYATCYINGIEKPLISNGLSEVNTAITSSVEPLLLGNRLNGSYYFQGKLDEVRIWNDVRTQSEIQEYMYKHLSGSEAGLVAYYKMNGTVSTLLDDSANSLDGTITGATRLANTYTGFSSGSGSIADPFIVNSVDNLLVLSSHIEIWNKYYLQTEDIDASDMLNWNNGAGLDPIGTQDNNFTGSYNGGNYSINNLFIDRSSESFVGFFGYFEGDTLQGTHLINANITGNGFCGGLVGNGHYVIYECSVDGLLHGGSYVGGLVGNGGGGCQIISSYNAADIYASYHVGGIVGKNALTDLIDCYNTGSITASRYIGGLAGETRDSVLNCYSTGVINGSLDAHPLCGLISNEGFIKNSIYNSDSSGVLSARTNSIGKTTEQMQTRTTYTQLGWDLTNTWSIQYIMNNGFPYLQNSPLEVDLNALAPKAGDGSPSTPYEIADTRNLYWLSQSSSEWDKHYKQTTNINASFTSSLDDNAGFTPIGNLTTNFTGAYNGQGYRIDSLTINRNSTDNIGFFGYTACDTIQNLGLKSISITGNDQVGALIGNGNAIIHDCYSSGNIQGANYVGGLLGYIGFTSDIQGCYNAATVSATTYGGGLCAFAESPISNSYNTASINVSSGYGGGLASRYKTTTISNCYSTGTVTASYSHALIGEYKGGASLSNCFWNSDTIPSNSETGASGISTENMKIQSTYTNAGWDFNFIWTIDAEYNQGYPYLSTNPTFDTPLPINLEFFTAITHKGLIELNWKTASETNNSRFLIYRNNEVIGAVNGAGTTSEPHNYNFIDYSVVPGVAYTYVLADIDYANVENKYENDAVTITIANDIIEAGFMVGAAYPNPFNPRININFQLSAANHVEAYIYNTKGTLVEELLNCEMMIGSHELAWNATNKPSGIYILKMISGNIVNSQKVILIK